MSCEHGYSSGWDCPLCPCPFPGCEKTEAECPPGAHEPTPPRLPPPEPPGWYLEQAERRDGAADAYRAFRRALLAAFKEGSQ